MVRTMRSHHERGKAMANLLYIYKDENENVHHTNYIYVMSYFIECADYEFMHRSPRNEDNKKKHSVDEKKFKRFYDKRLVYGRSRQNRNRFFCSSHIFFVSLFVVQMNVFVISSRKIGVCVRTFVRCAHLTSPMLLL